ncbi:hypothetical protein D9M68_962010 [compost metagenome]
MIALAQVEDVYTDAEAASKARLLIGEAHALHARVAEICSDPNATGLLYEAAEEVVNKLDGWPEHHQKSQALTSYHSCRQSMVDVQSYAYTCAQGGFKGEAVKYMQRRWAEDSASCDEAIRASELSR